MVYNIYNESCLGLSHLNDNSIECVATDPPYGIHYHNMDWDRALPPVAIWADCLRVLKPGGFAAVFSSVRLMHRMMVALEDSGFIIKDVLFWAYLNGMPKSRNIALDIDKQLGVNSQAIGDYKYVQGYKKNGAEDYYVTHPKKVLSPTSPQGKQYKGMGNGIKPIYEPIILVQKPLEKGLNIANNVLKYGVGGLNLEDTRIPYAPDEGKVGHNPHPKGRVCGNIIRTEPFEDGYDKFFLVPKVRQNKDNFNTHPTLKPIDIMNHIIRLISFTGHTVLDPFMGSGSTGVSALGVHRHFIGYEISKKYYEIAQKRLESEKSLYKQNDLMLGN